MTTIPFNFSIEQQYTCNIDTNIVLKLERVSYSNAMLAFTDDNNILISIPDKIVVYTYEMAPTILTIKQKLSPIHPNYYALIWTDNYDILYEDKLILSIKTPRTWNIVCPSNSLHP